MTMTTFTTAPPAKPFRLEQLPGEFGPVIRCIGSLNCETAPALRALLAPYLLSTHPVIAVNLTACPKVDGEGALVILEALRKLREQGRWLALICGGRGIHQAVVALGLARLMPVFSDEAALNAALLKSRAAPEPPESWAIARERTLETWRDIHALLDTASTPELLRRVSGMHGTCRRAESLVEPEGGYRLTRCLLCPLFYALGGDDEDIGCRSVREPIMHALIAGDSDRARALVARLIDQIGRMPIPGS
jgi:anti-anti-sigma regulatory factor